MDPQFAFGRSVGWMGCLIVFGLLAVAVGVAAVGWHLLLPGSLWSPRKSVVYGGLVLVTSLITHDVLAYVAHRNLAVGDYLVQAKIEYFCLDDFTPDQCLYHAKLCPSCAKKINRWNLAQMRDRLRKAQEALVKADSLTSSPYLRQPAQMTK